MKTPSPMELNEVAQHLLAGNPVDDVTRRRVGEWLREQAVRVNRARSWQDPNKSGYR